MELALVVLFVAMLVREYTFQRERQDFQREREANTVDRQSLLQRIQAPETAVATYATGEPRDVDPVPALSDEDVWDVINGRAG